MKLNNHKKSYGKAVLTKEEVKGLIEAIDNQRDRTLIFVAYESGCK